MVFAKATFAREQYEAAFGELWVGMWEQGLDVSKPELLAEVLGRHFEKEDVKRILEAANTAEWKQRLLDNTQRALEKGAFGAPWFWVRNGSGEEEPFFGSDR
jgi:glutathione S-transferase kappa 1